MNPTRPRNGSRGTFDLNVTDPKSRIQAYMSAYSTDPDYDGFDALLLRNMRVVSATKTSSENGMESQAVFECDVVPGLCNSTGNMHGGAVATLVDNTTTAAQAALAEPDYWQFGGVSRTLNVTYLRPLQGGTTVTIECLVRSVGRRLATIQCIMKSGDGKILALGEHGKSALEDQVRRLKL